MQLEAELEGATGPGAWGLSEGFPEAPWQERAKVVTLMVKISGWVTVGCGRELV